MRFLSLAPGIWIMHRLIIVLFLLLCNGIVLLVMKHIYYHRIKICPWQIDEKILLLKDVYSIFVQINVGDVVFAGNKI